jgi:hypothetical protein
MPPVDSAVAEVSPAHAEGPAPDLPAKLHRSSSPKLPSPIGTRTA